MFLSVLGFVLGKVGSFFSQFFQRDLFTSGFENYNIIIEEGGIISARPGEPTTKTHLTARILKAERGISATGASEDLLGRRLGF